MVGDHQLIPSCAWVALELEEDPEIIPGIYVLMTEDPEIIPGRYFLIADNRKIIPGIYITMVEEFKNIFHTPFSIYISFPKISLWIWGKYLYDFTFHSYKPYNPMTNLYPRRRVSTIVPCLSHEHVYQTHQHN